MLKVVDIECIRKLHFREGWSIRKIAKEFHHSRKCQRRFEIDPLGGDWKLTHPLKLIR